MRAYADQLLCSLLCAFFRRPEPDQATPGPPPQAHCKSAAEAGYVCKFTFIEKIVEVVNIVNGSRGDDVVRWIDAIFGPVWCSGI